MLTGSDVWLYLRADLPMRGRNGRSGKLINSTAGHNQRDSEKGGNPGPARDYPENNRLT